MELGQWLLAGGGGAILLAVVQAVINRRKMGADTASVLTKAAAELVQPLTDRIHELEQQLDRVKAKAEDLEHQLDACRTSNRALRLTVSQMTRGEG